MAGMSVRFGVIWFSTMAVLGTGLVFAGLAVWPHISEVESGVLGICCGVIAEGVGWLHAMFWWWRED